MAAVDPRHAEAFGLLKQGRHEEAKAILEAIVRDDLADAAVLETLGDVREKLGDGSGALSAYAGAVVHLRARTEHDRALNVLELMLVLQPDNAWARAESADIYALRGDGVACWRELAEASAAYIAAGEVERTLDMCQRYDALLPSDLTHALLIVEHLSRARQRRAAARMCTALGHALRKKKRVVPALELYARAVALDPQCREAHHARVGGLLALGQLDDAHAAAVRAVDTDKRDVVAITLLERVCMARSDHAGVEEARARMEEASALRDAPRTSSGEAVADDVELDDKTREDTASGEPIADEVEAPADVRTDLDD
jgi:tetratricopeptide (TPR) repeat protein